MVTPEMLYALLQIIIGMIETLIGINSAPPTDPMLVDLRDAVANLASSVLAVEHETTIIDADVLAARSEAFTNDLSILQAVSAGFHSGSPVILPEPPPPGYGPGASVGAIVDGVWAQTDPSSGHTFGYLASQSGEFAHNLALRSFFGVASAYGFALWAPDWADISIVSIALPAPFFDPSLILASDNILTYLIREQSSFSWDSGAGGSGFISAVVGGGAGRWLVTIDEATFHGLAGANRLPMLVPPVWPGRLNVAYVHTGPIVDGLTVDTPCDGVEINLSHVPLIRGFFDFGFERSWRNIGAISFRTDDSKQETPQLLGFEQAIYTPKTMVKAKGFRVRLGSGIVGTIKAWEISPP